MQHTNHHQTKSIMSSNLTISSSSIENCTTLNGGTFTSTKSVSDSFEPVGSNSSIRGTEGNLVLSLDSNSSKLVVKNTTYTSDPFRMCTGDLGISLGRMESEEDPAYPLHVHGVNDPSGVSIHAEGSVHASGGVLVSSDRRIKSNIVKSDTAEDLALINAIEVTTYDYKDGRESGIEGFIAQQVREVMPSAVKLQAGNVPCAMNCIDAVVTPHSSAVDVTMHASAAEGVVVGDVLLGRLSLRSGDDMLNTPVQASVKSVEASADESGAPMMSIKLQLKNHAGGAIIMKDGDRVEVLSFDAKRVSDFHSLCKERIAAVHVGATQELSRQVAELKAELSSLKQLMKQKLGWPSA